MRQLLPLALSANTVVVMWLAGSKRTLAWVLGLIGQAGWLAFVIVFDAWGLLPLVAALSFVYARNLLRWRYENAIRAGLADWRAATEQRGSLVVDSSGMRPGYTPPSASLNPSLRPIEHVVLTGKSIGLPEQESLAERLARAEHDAGRPIGGLGHQSHCWLCRRAYEQQQDRERSTWTR